MLQIYLLKSHFEPFYLISMQKHNHLTIHKTLRNDSHFQNLDLYHLAYEIYLKQSKSITDPQHANPAHSASHKL